MARIPSMSTTVTTFLRRLAGPVQELPSRPTDFTLRLAVPADADDIDRLAQLDSRRAPRGAVLLAEVGGELWVAMSIDDGHAVADPFRPTGELVAMLLERARQMRSTPRTPELPSVWPRTGYDRAALN
jgi:hypothetical protein